MCERFIVKDEKWELIPSFKEKVETDVNGSVNCLFTYGICSSF